MEKLLNVNFVDTFRVVAMCQNIDTSKIAIEKFKPEIVFLDVEMPKKNGFELLENIGLIDFKIIFTTSCPEYAIKAIQFGAFDYLIKPVNKIDLISVMKRFDTKNSKKSLQINHFDSKED